MQFKFALFILGLLVISSYSQGAAQNALLVEEESQTFSDSARTGALVDQALDILYKDPASSISLIDSALAIVPSDSILSFQVGGLAIKGIALSMTGDTKAGLRLFHKVRRYYEDKGDEENLAKSASNLASVHRLNGRTDSTCYYMLESLHHVIMLRDTAMLISDYSNIAGFFLEYDDMDRAQKYVDACLELEAPSGLYEDFATTYQIKGYLEMESGRYDAAEKSFIASDERATKKGDDRLRANLIRDIATVRSYLGEEVEARSNFILSLKKAEKVGVRHHVAGVFNDFALFEARMGNRLKADSLFKEALTIYESVGAEMDVSEVLLGMAKNDLERADLEKARERATRSLALAEKAEALHREVDCLELLTTITSRQGDEEAVKKYDRELGIKLQLIQEDWDMLEGVMDRLEVPEARPEVESGALDDDSHPLTGYVIAGVMILLLVLLLRISKKKNEGVSD